MRGARARERGVVLAGVTLFLLVLVIAATVFIERATVDALIAFNRDNAARAEALGRGGIQLAMALLSVMGMPRRVLSTHSSELLSAS